jgi:hypothetical protein
MSEGSNFDFSFFMDIDFPINDSCNNFQGSRKYKFIDNNDK